MGNAQQVRDQSMAARLNRQAFRRVDQHDGQIRRRCAGDHIARVLLVARRVGDDELAFRRGEIAIGDVNGDALLALGDQAIGQQGQIDRVRAPFLAGFFNRRELVFENGFRVVQQTADQRTLTIINAARRGKAQQLHGFRPM